MSVLQGNHPAWIDSKMKGKKELRVLNITETSWHFEAQTKEMKHHLFTTGSQSLMIIIIALFLCSLCQNAFQNYY